MSVNSGLDSQSGATNEGMASSKLPRVRKDLHWSIGEPSSTGERSWVAKDPISLKYYRLRDDERFLIDQLDGTADLNIVRDRYNLRFAPRRVTTSQVQQLVNHFFREGLVVSSSSGQSRTIQSRRTIGLKDKLRQFSLSWLFLRLPGISADGVATKLEAFFRPVLNPIALGLLIGCSFLAFFCLLASYRLFLNDVQELSRWTSVHGMVLLGVVIGACKTLHELGHAIACKHFGGECHEIGLMFMFGIPCLYCDTTDSWRNPNRVQRVIVSSGGIIVELLLGTVAVAVWWMTKAGTIHWISFDVVLVCLLGSLAFNANPLLRYDGYYILSDLLGVSNLQHESKTRWLRFKRRVFQGPQPLIAPERSFGMRTFMVVYHIAATCYRVMLLVLLAWAAFYLCKQIGYPVTGWLLIAIGTAIYMVSVAVPVTIQSVKTAWVQRFHPNWERRLVRGSIIRATLLIAVGLLLFYPFDKRVHCVGELSPSSLTPIQNSVAGTLKSFTPYNTELHSGDLVAILENSRTLLDQINAEGAWRQQKIVVDDLKRLQIDSPSLGSSIPQAEAMLATREKQNREAEQLVDQLAVRSFSSGVWIEPSRLPVKVSSTKDLGGWQELPLKASNQGCWIESGTLLGWVAKLDKLQFKVLVTQSEIEWIRPGFSASIYSRVLPELALQATVTEISNEPAKELDPRQAHWPGVINDGQRLASSGAGQPAESSPGTPPGIAPVEVSYWVTLEASTDDLPEGDLQAVRSSLTPMIGSEVRAFISAGRENLIMWCWRALVSQLRF